MLCEEIQQTEHDIKGLCEHAVNITAYRQPIYCMDYFKQELPESIILV